MELLIWILATYRLTILIVYEDGPFDVLIKLRSSFSINQWLNKGINCPWCVSFWLSLFVLFLPTIVTTWLAIAGGVAVIMSFTVSEKVIEV